MGGKPWGVWGSMGNVSYYSDVMCQRQSWLFQADTVKGGQVLVAQPQTLKIFESKG